MKQNQFVPIVVEPDSKGYDRSYDIYSRLLKERIVFLTGEIGMEVANTVIAQLLYLQAEDSEKEIKLYINSPGGSVYSGLAIYDTVKQLKPEVSTICVGTAASMASMILAGGTKGKRYALEHSLVLIHQPLMASGPGGQASDIEIHAKEILRLRALSYELLSKDSGTPVQKIEKDADRDYHMSADEAKKYGIIDKILK